MAEQPSLPRQSSTEELVRSEGGSMPHEPDGSIRAAIANAMVAMKKQHYGRGPTAAKAWILDDYVFVVMDGGLTRSEETLAAAGRQDIIRQYRLVFEEAMAATTMGAVAELTGREVLTYQSQIVFDPPRTFEIFVLAPQ